MKRSTKQPKPVKVRITSQREQLHPDELAAAESYASWAASQGRDWKESLSDDWYYAGERTRYPGEWSPLQRLRNQQGWEWLEAVEYETVEVQG